MIGNHLRPSALVEILSACRPLEVGVCAVYASRRRIAPKVRVLIDFLVEALRIRTWHGRPIRAAAGRRPAVPARPDP